MPRTPLLRKGTLLMLGLVAVPWMVWAQQPAQDQSWDRPLSLQQAVRRTLARHPSLPQMQARIAASRERSIQAGQLQDPKLSFGVLNVPTDTFDLDQEPMTQIAVGVEQAFPYPGKLELRQELESFQGQALKYQRRALEADLIRQVRKVWLERFYQDRALEVIAENTQLFEDLVQMAQSQYVVGQGLQQDVLLAQLERDKLQDERQQVLERARRLDSQLAELMALSRQEFTLPDTLPQIPLSRDLEGILDTVPEHPLVLARKAVVEQAQTRADLVRKAFYPDFGVNVSYGHRRDLEPDGDRRADFVSARVKVDLPVFPANRQERGLAAARLEVSAAKRAVETQVLKLEQQARSQVATLSRTLKRIDLYEQTILPQSQQTVKADMAAYMAGEIGFLELVRSRILDFNHQLILSRLRVDAQKARSDLLYLLFGGRNR